MYNFFQYLKALEQDYYLKVQVASSFVTDIECNTYSFKGE